MLNELLLWVSFAGQVCGAPISDVLPGFQLTEVQAGSGPRAGEGDVVTIQFVASTLEGKELASTEKRGIPYRFKLCDPQSPIFMDLSVMGMQAGGERRAVVPPEFGYGVAGMPPIVPQKTTMVIVFKLVKIEVRSQESGARSQD